jgi:hypothetical protein
MENNKPIQHALVVEDWQKVSISRLKGVLFYTNVVRWHLKPLSSLDKTEIQER